MPTNTGKKFQPLWQLSNTEQSQTWVIAFRFKLNGFSVCVCMMYHAREEEGQRERDGLLYRKFHSKIKLNASMTLSNVSWWHW
jgi:hypothetical protein